MSRDVDRVIEYVRELARERFLPPVMAQVMIDRLDPAPTSDEIERAAATVPDSRFRDQLAEAIAAHEPRYRSGYNTGEPDWFECGPAFAEPRCDWRSDPESDDIGADHRTHVADVIAAEVEARVQAAAKEFAAEQLELAAVLTVPAEDTSEEVREALTRRAAALRAGEAT